MKSSDVTCILFVIVGIGMYVMLHVVAGHDPKTGIVSVFTLTAFAQIGALRRRISELEANTVAM